ncbi:MAG: hypothetical protein NXH95_01920 [Pseudomonadaceae bacterium]|nr:hypothetical protein [Pseudomonadaceae bacterium]
MSSARSITAAVNPPRAVYLDYPLGHTTGKPSDPSNQLAIMRDTLAAFEQIDEPGTIIDLDYHWQADDGWKDSVMRPQPGSGDNSTPEHNDTRTERYDTPQYQSEDDAAAADPHCPSCIFLKEG